MLMLVFKLCICCLCILFILLILGETHTFSSVQLESKIQNIILEIWRKLITKKVLSLFKKRLYAWVHECFFLSSFSFFFFGGAPKTAIDHTTFNYYSKYLIIHLKFFGATISTYCFRLCQYVCLNYVCYCDSLLLFLLGRNPPLVPSDYKKKTSKCYLNFLKRKYKLVEFVFESIPSKVF